MPFSFHQNTVRFIVIYSPYLTKFFLFLFPELPFFIQNPPSKRKTQNFLCDFFKKE